MHLHLNEAARRWRFLSIQLAQLLVLTVGHCVSIIVPSDLANAYGNGGSTVPFDTTATGTARYQQVYDASQFTSQAPAGAFIKLLVFRVDESVEGFQSVLPSIQIDLSTTAKAPDALSPIFAQNVGVDDRVVFGTGPLSIHSIGAGGPGTWDIIIPLATPFFYLPSAGNLLMDVRNFGGGSSTPFDGVHTAGDSVSSVYAYTGDGTGSVNSTSGRVFTFGLATLFEVTPVPEPASLSLLILGFCAIALAARRCKAGWRT